MKSIANDVLTKQEQQESIKDKILDGLIKYGKELIIACITVIIASLFIIGKSNIGISSTASEMGGFENSAMTSAKFKKNIAIAEVMNVLGPLRMELTEYYYNERKFPKTLKQLGFNVNDFKKSKNIENIVIDTSGSIIVKLKNSIEKDVIFKFSPQTMMGAIEWSCFTNFSGSLPFCEKKSLTTDLKALIKN